MLHREPTDTTRLAVAGYSQLTRQAEGSVFSGELIGLDDDDPELVFYIECPSHRVGVRGQLLRFS